MTDLTPEDPPAGDADVLATDRDAEDRDPEEIADQELPLDPAGPTELGDAVGG